MAKVFSVNAGSSSLKFQLYEMPAEDVLTDGIVDRIGSDKATIQIKVDGEKIKKEIPIHDHKQAAELVLEAILEHKIVDSLDDITGVGHRIVHGGDFFSESVLVDQDVLDKVEGLSKLAPLHNPAHLLGYQAFKAALNNAEHVFVFDTAFHQTMDPEVFLYPLPYDYYTDYKVRKYGFHGTSHKYVTNRVAELLDKPVEETNTIICHLGNGASLTAIKNGKVIDTSMGFTPLAGVMMGTRTGDIDPAIMPYLMEQTGKTAEEILEVYNHESGMLGISQFSNDARDIEDAANEGNEQAILTSQMYSYKIATFIGSYFVQLGHVDAIAFTAGIGENDTGVRERVISLVSEAMGIVMDYDMNNKTRGKEARLSTDDSKVAVYVVPTDEELVIAQDTYRVLSENE